MTAKKQAKTRNNTQDVDGKQLAVDTFVALSTVPGESALAVIRICGPLVTQLAHDALRPGGTKLRQRVARYGQYYSLEETLLDDVVYIYYPAKSSYTGRDTLEISTHGNPLLYQKILSDLIKRGCRQAEPGEFTRTAFLEGKMDLSQAEAVADLIRARSDAAVEAAQRQLAGGLGQEIDQRVEEIVQLLAQIEAYIDFPEDDLPDEDQQGPLLSLRDLIQKLDTMIATGPMRELLHEGIQTVLIGEVNVGKSSLLNRLLGRARALVNEAPGTTRDYIEDAFQIGKYCIRITDTAGWREDATGVEKEGIENMMQKVGAADFILLVIDGSKNSPPTLPARILNKLQSKNSLIVINKADQPSFHNFEEFIPHIPHVEVSAKEGLGWDLFLNQWENSLSEKLLQQADQRVLYNQRHIDYLRNCRNVLSKAQQQLKDGVSTEWVTTDIREAIDYLSAIVGKIDNEQMLDVLFGSFCIGK